MKHEARIRTLAARYEACLTTEAEERELRSLLSAEQTLPRDLQALAIMLVCSLQQRHSWPWLS